MVPMRSQYVDRVYTILYIPCCHREAREQTEYIQYYAFHGATEKLESVDRIYKKLYISGWYSEGAYTILYIHIFHGTNE